MGQQDDQESSPDGQPGPPGLGAYPPPSLDTPIRPGIPASLRVRAVFEVLACSGLPTQLAIGQTLAVAGVPPTIGAQLNVHWVFWVALLDTIALIALTLLFLRANGDSPWAVFVGPRRPAAEVGIGLLLVVPVLLAAGLVLLAAQRIAPGLHNVAENPLAALMQSPRDAWLFGIVAVVGGGIREEIQRAFVITRFAQYLGGAPLGLVLTSVAFGLGHALQGWDAALATGVLGFLWGAIYLWRRGAIASVTSHAGFNGLEIARYLLLGVG